MLTDAVVKTAKAADKTRKLTDGRGMYLLVVPDGAKYWRFDYRIGGRRKTISLGVYPDVGLKDARERREEARKQVASGIDPSLSRKATRTAAVNTFEAVAREWHSKYKATWSEDHEARILRRFEVDLFPWLGARPIAEIKAAELLTALRRIEARGAVETAHRALQNSGQVFRYAVATGRAERDPSRDLKGALPPVKGSHLASITEPKAVGDLLRALGGYSGTFPVKTALLLAPLVFVRPGELRRAEWTEFNLAEREWRIPAERMKMRAPHIVPLADQAIALLQQLQGLTGGGRYVFPSIRSAARPMSENTVNAALRRLGYSKDQMTGHGFRSMASTLLNEQGWNRDAIERQLAHAERDGVRAAYNYAEYLQERRKMMQAWADFLDGLKTGAPVVSLRHAA